MTSTMNQGGLTGRLRGVMAGRRLQLLALPLGILLAIVCALIGPLLDPPAIARWSVQSNDQDEMRAALGLIGIRHLPMFLLAVALGNVIFRLVKSTAPWAIAVTTAPYLAYVIGRGVLDSLAAGETAFSWVTYEPAYFIWPHFVAVPLGLFAAARMVARKKSRSP